jgi:cobalamin biosynthesis protein CobT
MNSHSNENILGLLDDILDEEDLVDDSNDDNESDYDDKSDDDESDNDESDNDESDDDESDDDELDDDELDDDELDDDESDNDESDDDELDDDESDDDELDDVDVLDYIDAKITQVVRIVKSLAIKVIALEEKADVKRYKNVPLNVREQIKMHSSALTVNNFCRLHNISRDAYYYFKDRN